jgi:hypothetical protein
LATGGVECLILDHEDGMDDGLGGEGVGVGLVLKGKDEFDIFLGYGGGCCFGRPCHHDIAPGAAFLRLNCSLRLCNYFFILAETSPLQPTMEEEVSVGSMGSVASSNAG